MGADDKAQNKAEELKGEAKEGFGRRRGTGGRRPDRPGISNVKQAGEKVKDAFKR
jgi:hypothetical protein